MSGNTRKSCPCGKCDPVSSLQFLEFDIWYSLSQTARVTKNSGVGGVKVWADFKKRSV